MARNLTLLGNKAQTNKNRYIDRNKVSKKMYIVDQMLFIGFYVAVVIHIFHNWGKTQHEIRKKICTFLIHILVLYCGI